MFPRRRRRWLLELLEDRAAAAHVAPSQPDIEVCKPAGFEQAIGYSCSFLDALTPFTHQPIEQPLPAKPRPMFINDFLVDLTPDRGVECITLRVPLAPVFPPAMAA